MGRKPKTETKQPAKAAAAKTDAKPKGKRAPQPIPRLRGMRDFLPDEYRYWKAVMEAAENVAGAYGFLQTELPVFEQANLYERSTGKETDIVSKEMYAFVDKDGDRIAARPEATPGLVRSYIEHGLFNWPMQPVKLYWAGSLFRREKPQAGRYRQFWQADLEMFGETTPAADAQMIVLGYLILKEVGINAQVQVNSIGDPEDRASYVKKLQEYLKDRKIRALLSVDDKKRLQKNPLRILDSKEEGTQKALSGAPQMIDHISDAAREHFVKVLEYLDEFDIPYTLNPALVRGLDYYNRTVFEFWPEGGDTSASQGALGGGGRYDGLVEFMGGRPTPACGFALGIDRVVLRMKDQGVEPPAERPAPEIFVAQLGDAAKRKAMVFFEELRAKGYKVAQNFVKDSLKAQLEQANKLGVKLTLIMGQKEVMDETVLIRDMESGMQEVYDFKKIYEELDKRL